MSIHAFELEVEGVLFPAVLTYTYQSTVQGYLTGRPEYCYPDEGEEWEFESLVILSENGGENFDASWLLEKEEFRDYLEELIKEKKKGNSTYKSLSTDYYGIEFETLEPPEDLLSCYDVTTDK